MENLKNKTIGSFVAQDYRTAAVFSKYRIDFCCKGNRTVDEVCEKQNIDADVLLQNIHEVIQSENNGSIDFNSWPLDLLADYIEKTHHRYVEDKTHTLLAFLDKLCKVHGANYPELFKINELFIGCAGELSQHMKKEELILFPFVKRMTKTKESDGILSQPSFGSVSNPIAMMMHEHDNEGERFREIAALTDHYTPPADACTTYKVTFAMLKEFEEDLHKHIHLENNILFPKAVLLEKDFVEVE
ncbi:iron-sulfur cluster repair di-iron protein [Flavobacterium johnsoniae]|uniref:Hemerythrin HHE cation binding domain protein n=1 Tax=Flavobacterium johnsoniae (strain ATCC 17061 / DSM 2064 / JCM 8514 / BCRC 14874 / CCUG 350202 / NBRC 14942 / NCIMB 11054 / UW101) TaxID=376686 RepID=A5FH84_FLAJ1|nr:iron-sulfur cluster repair di-iron protein [Flavobacterium johnsoniae]ABQ05441.1 Hemerythrin HHE cation binding domain protein [Flavobacterium johnsoniae UW101]OXE96821.1 iron-sulfur cluster repair di-iron protein [Flavobacterium johnsoniae UW101]WQG82756.1 iron-sulfur cluster repair di-iron protein [Flavobacterium johnsoniae UW101]SHL56841.1 regulator of cell morphogenesis and NO signaling [Flavobacterium johnsoniae]